MCKVAADHRNLWEMQGRLEYDAQCVVDRGRHLNEPKLIARGEALQREVQRLTNVLKRRKNG